MWNKNNLKQNLNLCNQCEVTTYSVACSSDHVLWTHSIHICQHCVIVIYSFVPLCQFRRCYILHMHKTVHKLGRQRRFKDKEKWNRIEHLRQSCRKWKCHHGTYLRLCSTANRYASRNLRHLPSPEPLKTVSIFCSPRSLPTNWLLPSHVHNSQSFVHTFVLKNSNR